MVMEGRCYLIRVRDKGRDGIKRGAGSRCGLKLGFGGHGCGLG